MIPENLNTPEFLTTWEAWKRYRTEIKHKLTPSTANAQLKKFAEWGPDRAIAAITYTIEKGWQGIQEPAAKQKTFGHQEPTNPAGYVAKVEPC